MTYEVIWLPDTEQELAAIWLAAADRQAITDSANALDKRLRLDPGNEGESREAGERVVFSQPLGVRVRVIPDDRRVEVLRVWRF